jgi:hypothetical protein
MTHPDPIAAQCLVDRIRQTEVTANLRTRRLVLRSDVKIKDIAHTVIAQLLKTGFFHQDIELGLADPVHEQAQIVRQVRQQYERILAGQNLRAVDLELVQSIDLLAGQIVDHQQRQAGWPRAVNEVATTPPDLDCLKGPPGHCQNEKVGGEADAEAQQQYQRGCFCAERLRHHGVNGVAEHPDANQSGSWVDPLIGGRYHIDLPSGFGFTAYGDAGGVGVAAHSDWQLMGTIDYTPTPLEKTAAAPSSRRFFRT